MSASSPARCHKSHMCNIQQQLAISVKSSYKKKSHIKADTNKSTMHSKQTYKKKFQHKWCDQMFLFSPNTKWNERTFLQSVNMWRWLMGAARTHSIRTMENVTTKNSFTFHSRLFLFSFLCASFLCCLRIRTHFQFLLYAVLVVVVVHFFEHRLWDAFNHNALLFVCITHICVAHIYALCNNNTWCDVMVH